MDFEHPFEQYPRYASCESDTRFFIRNICDALREFPYIFEEFEPHSSLIGSLFFNLSFLPKILCFLHGKCIDTHFWLLSMGFSTISLLHHLVILVQYRVLQRKHPTRQFCKITVLGGMVSVLTKS